MYLERALIDGHAVLSGEQGRERIKYVAANRVERYSDPEEHVRAEFWAELIYRYGYDPKKIGIEVTVPDRKPTDAADIVIFSDDSLKRPFAVIECKRDGIPDAEFNQAVEQACGNGTWAKFRASYVMVVAGRTTRALDFTEAYGVLERESNIIADLPIRYGRPEEFKYHKGSPLDIQQVGKETLINAIKKCHQTLWGGGKLSPPSAFGELCKLIFVKISDEKTKRAKGEPYQFQIKTHETSRRLAERIRALYEAQKARDPEVFTENIKIDDPTLRTVVSHLESINLSKTDLDTKGLAFEQFMDGFFKGDFGQYFTPREIINFMVSLAGTNSEEKVLDPACGTGGFLLHVLDAVRNDANRYWERDSAEHYAHWHDFAEKRLFGIEINDEIARVAKMNMILHDDGHTNVIGGDALQPFDSLIQANKGFARASFDLILTNPPFGAKVINSERLYLADYELGTKTTNGRAGVRTSQKTEVLFLERCFDFLKPGTGRLAIVLPDSILTNASLQDVRDWIIEHFQIIAVISLPESAFAHFGSGVKTSIAMLRKRASKEGVNPEEKIFMAAPALIGYDATGRKTENELPQVLSDFNKERPWDTK